MRKGARALQLVNTLTYLWLLAHWKNHNLWERQVISATFIICLAPEKDPLTHTKMKCKYIAYDIVRRTCSITAWVLRDLLSNVLQLKLILQLNFKQKMQGSYSLLSPRRNIGPFHLCTFVRIDERCTCTCRYNLFQREFFMYMWFIHKTGHWGWMP